MVLKTMSSNEVKQRWGLVMGSAGEEGDEIVVKSHGSPKVAVIPYESLVELHKLRRDKKRALALQRFRELKNRLATKNQDLSEQDVEDLSNRFSHEFVDDLAAEGKLRFERDR